jgi:hypothetical protein
MQDIILVYILHWRFSPKVMYAGTPIVTQNSFAFKGRRKQYSKNIGRACGVSEVVDFKSQ